MKLALGIVTGLILGALVFGGGTAFAVVNNVIPAVEKSLDNNNTQNQPTTTTSPSANPTQSTTKPNTTSAAVPTTTIPLQGDLSGNSFQLADGQIRLQVSIVSIEGTGFTRTVTGKVLNNGTVTLHNTQLKVELFSDGKQLKFNDGQPSWQKSYGTLAAGATLTDQITAKLSLIDGFNAAQYGIDIHLTFTSTEKSQTVIYHYSLN
jgi:hypothetical protein